MFDELKGIGYLIIPALIVNGSRCFAVLKVVLNGFMIMLLFLLLSLKVEANEV